MSFKQVLNDAIRRGLTDGPAVDTSATLPKAMGAPKVDLTKALQVAGALEDVETIAKLRRGS